MEQGMKTACTASIASETLRERLIAAKEALSEAAVRGSVDEILSLRAEIRELPTRIDAAEKAEIRARLEQIEMELDANQQDIRLIDTVRVQRKLDLEEAMKAVEPLHEAYARCQMELSLKQNSIALLYVNRREAKAKLFGLTEKMKG